MQNRDTINHGSGPIKIIRGLSSRLVFFALLWAVFSNLNLASLPVATLFVTLAAILSLRLAGKNQATERWLMHPLVLLSFLRFFIVQSFRGGWAIAKIACLPSESLSPGLVSYKTELKTDTNIFALMQILSLLPGTVSVGRTDNLILIHVIDIDSFQPSEIDDCQTWVSRLRVIDR